MSSVLDELLGLLTLESDQPDLYVGQSQDLGFRRLFGGHVLGQALVAATNTCDHRNVHSLHAYFIRSGDAYAPIRYRVERIRDGKSFSVRQVTATQHDKPILIMSASLQVDENGYAHQTAMPEVPPPESLVSEVERARAVADRIPEKIRQQFIGDRPIEIRRVDPVNPFAPIKKLPVSYAWFRAVGTMPADRTLNQCLLAYASDFGLLATSLRPHGITYFQRNLMTASLDHAMWFYRDFRMDDWLLYACDSPVAANARGFSRGNIFTRDGKLVACVAQEGLVRQLDEDHETRTTQG